MPEWNGLSWQGRLSSVSRPGIMRRDMSRASLKAKPAEALARPPRELRPFLESLLARYHRTDYLDSDPLEFVHRFQDPWDREAVALFSALLAYGNVRQIRAAVADLLERMVRSGGSPAGFVRALASPRPGRTLQKERESALAALDGFYHRWTRGPDLVLLASLLAAAWEKHGSLGRRFSAGISTPDTEGFSSALDRLVLDWKEEARAQAGLPPSEFFFHLLNAPSSGSCCKRWCMFLRWMGRRDELDPGLWREDSPLIRMDGRSSPVIPLRSSMLVIPIDTHTGRISQYLGLTDRKSLGWNAALEVTANLRACDPDDPVKYDFALSRLGILNLCQKKYRVEICQQCELLTACRFAAAKRSSSGRSASTRSRR